MPLFDTPLFHWVVIPAAIVLIRICDVSLGTVRIILISKGNRYIAPILGFCEVMIWLFAISRIIQNLDNILYYVAYAGGFALGNLIGILIEEKMAVGIISLRIITRKDADELIHTLQADGYRTTTVEGHGMEGSVHVIYTIIKRQNLENLVRLIKQHNPQAFYTLEDIRFVSKALSPFREPLFKNRTTALLKRIRKGK